MEVIGIIALVAVFMGGAIWLAKQMEAKRRAAVAALATRMGWQFEPQPAMPPIVGLEPFSGGRSHRTLNRVTSQRTGEPVSTFDFYYITGSGKNSHHHSLTVAEIALPQPIPAFSLRPEHFGHRIAGVFGMQDLDFPDRPAFSKTYLLRGADEYGIRGLFTHDVLDFFEAHPGLGVVTTGNQLYLWHGSLKPEQWEGFMSLLAELRDRLVGPR